MPSDAAFKFMNAAHRAVRTLTFGKLGWSGYGMPVLELTTIGRRSGEARTVLLTTPLRFDDTIVVVASRGGDDRHPAWFRNIEANPDVTVRLEGGAPVAMKARPATADERAELWPKVTADHANYAGYQKKTEREIPLVLLTPA